MFFPDTRRLLLISTSGMFESAGRPHPESSAPHQSSSTRRLGVAAAPRWTAGRCSPWTGRRSLPGTWSRRSPCPTLICLPRPPPYRRSCRPPTPTPDAGRTKLMRVSFHCVCLHFLISDSYIHCCKILHTTSYTISLSPFEISSIFITKHKFVQIF